MKNKKVKLGAIILSVLLIIGVSSTFILRNSKNTAANKSEISQSDEVKDKDDSKNSESKDSSDGENSDKDTGAEKESNENEDKNEIDFNSINDKNQDSSNKENINKNDSNKDDNNNNSSNNSQTTTNNNGNNTETSKPEPVEKYVTISITCNTILNNLDKVPEGKKDIIPSNGVIMSEKQVEIKDGDTVFDVLVRETRKQRIHMDFVESPVYNSAYIKGINNLYEFDGGELSGWMYNVNGVFPNYGCSQYQLKAGDVIQWKYTCDLGRDL